jgi:hypothetical protein
VFDDIQQSKNKRPPKVKVAANSIYTRQRAIPSVKFEANSQMTSFGGLVIFQALFQQLDLWKRLQECCSHLAPNGYYSHALVLRLLVVHLLLGFKNLQDSAFYRSDPMVLRTLEIQRMPSVSTISRLLADFDEKSVGCTRIYVRDLVLDRLATLQLPSLTLDFDGSVLSTKRHAEGTAVGFNKRHKGWRSYYPLFCTIAQTGQVLNVLHRSGNVHDSNGAIAFIKQCIADVRAIVPKVRIEVRLDSAFFSDAILRKLEEMGVTYTISVPSSSALGNASRTRSQCNWISFARWRPSGNTKSSSPTKAPGQGKSPLFTRAVAIRKRSSAT